jgi:Domain of unknown function (DUF4145)
MAPREVRSVEELPDGRKFKTLGCGHTLLQMVIVANENVEIFENAEWVILRDPVEEIKKAVNDKDYFKMVAHACSIFEYCGKQILVWQSKKKGKQLSMKIVRNMELKTVINVLSSRGIINGAIKNKMHCIRKLRNSFIHKKYSLKLSSQMVKRVNASIHSGHN